MVPAPVRRDNRDVPRDATPDAARRSGTLLGMAAPRGSQPTLPEPVAEPDPWATPAPFLVPGALIGGRYVLGDRIARGGMGSIWAATDRSLDRRVAVKFLSADLADDVVVRERFDREARALAMLRSPHVAMVFDHGIEEGLPYIVMELLEGEDLQVRLATRGKLDLRTTSGIVTQVARALRQAHAAGIIHRDLKPENVFLARSIDEPSGEIVKVVDFGVAKMVGGPKATAAGVVVGSPHCMSPEQIRGKPDVDARADVWGLGVLAYVMLTGRRPYEGGLTEIALRIARGQRIAVTALEPDLPRAVDEVIDRALEPDRALRWASITDLAEALERVVDAAVVVPAVRATLDTPPVDLSPRSSRPSQRPTLIALEPPRELLPTPVQDLTPPSSTTWRVTPGGTRIEPPVEAPSRWPRLVVALVAVLVLLLVIALVWTP